MNYESYAEFLERKTSKLTTIIAKYKGCTQAVIEYMEEDKNVPINVILTRLKKLDNEIDLILNEKIYPDVYRND